ncbi:thiol:disulfide interchange protein DsbA/DsbL [Paraburkholderia caballeronis]|uniref:Thiol:disulfide interchange protein n=1 Tax=Paraburkholderia caballeronis TaxID=416943 RepID=A0A1H7HR54_9BURK|nr:thiol:disulfide interchange protein DsbA/DsbL [Paraburkholderia caballeronis]PXW29425.1 thiol:disulfide interchange protein DsbA [Paraburkholderia caballeronis]PXX04684.1 thiol:disulfide interchange protein DsbA [Paraburkholderia caballeronis]RAK05745.1 thiol:disulfide interchange protein DsbA [Paraburkholderia caballeronis]TDV18524.1 thiol:disulfide interchange protein DsbA [Paraburkholderia caballeronis]TDV19938.1 thiol:disulfide interchange protein DsbA [Paraburkholderia caballeronis]
MKRLLGSLLLSFSLIAAGGAQASPAAPVANKDYTVLKTPQPVDVPPGKIEVIEFFWYGCPHCNEFNPFLEAWIKKQEPDVVFRRVPVAFRDDFIPHSKMFYALDALGLAQKLTPVVFHEIHVNKNYLLTPEDQAKFLATQGVDPKKYMEAYNSFSTQSALKRDQQLLQNYQIDGVPTLAVQGKYLTGPASTNSLPGAIQVLDYLVAQVRAKKM